MADKLQHQVRLYFTPDGAASWRAGGPAHDRLRHTLARHGATLVSQLDAFEAFLAQPGAADTPLGRWTQATLADPDKRAHHALAFAARVHGAELYDQAAADALEADLRPAIGRDGVERLSRHDTDPATNLPVPEAFRTSAR